MVVSCLSEGCTISSETDRLLQCSIIGCGEVFCVRCFEKIRPEIGKEDHEFYFLCEGEGCSSEATWECQEETIAFCDECFKAEHKGRRQSHSKIALQRKRLKVERNDAINIFDSAVFGEMKHELVVADEELKWMQIAAENWINFKKEAGDEYCPVISFIGSTGTGKSFLVSSFVGDDKFDFHKNFFPFCFLFKSFFFLSFIFQRSGPSVAPTNQKGSTSANVNLFHAPGYDTNEFSFRKLLLLDCEGDGGTVPEMLRQRWVKFFFFV